MMLHRRRNKLPVIELGPPKYCVFQDMLAHHAPFALKRGQCAREAALSERLLLKGMLSEP